MYMPALTNGRVAARYQLGSYLLVVFTDCESTGMIEYLHVLFAFQPGERAPIFAVASEISTFTKDMHPDARFLGVFPGSGHINYGMSEDWMDLEKFTQRALEVTAEHFKIDTEPIKLPLDPRMN